MKKEEYNKVVEQARNANLVEYFQRCGYKTKQCGNEYYVKVPNAVALAINPEKHSWFDHYTGKGSYNSIDCLNYFFNMDFKQAVFELTGVDLGAKQLSSDYKPQYTPPKIQENVSAEKKELQMPQPAPNMKQLYAYMCQTRKIPAEIVNELVKAGLLYQSQNVVNTVTNGVPKTFNNANAVFVHKDANGKIVGGEVQGLNSFKRFKGMAKGTGETAFIFTPIPAKGDKKILRAYIFESAIDMMSFYTFCDKKKIVGATFVSMGGLKPTVPKQLEAQGIEIISCVDNDDAGRKFEAENNFVRHNQVKLLLDNQGFKDFNELLVFKSENPNSNPLEVLNQNQNNRKFFNRGK